VKKDENKPAYLARIFTFDYLFYSVIAEVLSCEKSRLKHQESSVKHTLKMVTTHMH